MDILTKWLRSYLPELSVDDTQLAEDLTLRGIAVEGVFPASCGGSRFEMDITTNRVDAMNHFGVAREVAAIYGLPLIAPDAGPAAPVPPHWAADPFPVRVEAVDLCGRFTARVIRGVSVRPATGTIAELFAALGQKSISGPVDATNFGWLAMGQPTHVFDLDKIEGGILVRRAREGELLRLLDGSERTLVGEDLVVADERKALGLAGVMGGWESRVTEETRNLLVEAAWFDPGAIRASSRRHGLHTDASHRFERGADFNAPPSASNLVTRLVLEQAGGEVVGPMTDAIVPALAAQTAERPPILLRSGQVRRLLGTTLEDAAIGPVGRSSGLGETTVAQFLTALGCALEPSRTVPGEYAVRLPSWRLDLEREIDLIEEVARVYGYNRFANTLPGWSGEVHAPPGRPQEAALRSTLLTLGYTEAISSTFTSPSEATVFGNPREGTVAMGNPLNDEAGVLRPSLASGMVDMLARNLTRDVSTVRLFEIGTVFTGSPAAVAEQQALAIGATGGALASTLHCEENALLFQLKGAVETLLGRFAGELTFAAGGEDRPLPPWIEDGRGAFALLDGEAVGVFGELNATVSSARKLRQPCVLADIDAGRLLRTPLRQPVLRELSRYQAVERDFSFIFPDAVSWGHIARSIRDTAPPELQQITPVEIFRDPKGKTVAEGTYSLLTRAVFQSPDRTLNDEELSSWSEQITGRLRSLGGVQRA